ncbi:MAG: AAA family ATPase [Oscillospiraceae bacterium]|nr:AAA family ATPase [Oscillospiraceae bacterium]
MDKENKALIFLMLDPQWKEKHKGGRPAIPLFVRDLRVAYPGTEVLQQDEESCTLSVICGEDQPERVEDRVSALLQNALGSEDIDLAQWRIWPWEQASDILKELESNGTLLPGSAESAGKAPVSAVMEKIENLLGAEDFKVLAREITSVAPQIHRYHTEESFARRCYLFAIGSGCGLTTCLGLLTDLIGEQKLFEFSGKRRVVEVPPEMDLKDMLKEVDDRGLVRQMVCFDLSHWMEKIHTSEFRHFLHKLRDIAGTQLFAFRIPFVDELTRAKVVSALTDVLTVQEVVIPTFTNAELRAYAERLLGEKGFTMEEDAWIQFEARLVAEKSDGHFYGLETVQKVVDEFLYQKHLSAVRAGSMNETAIASADLPPVSGRRRDARPAMEQLNDLIGIEAIRDRLMEVITQIELAQKEGSGLNPCLHMRFVGNPGTGKTTVARILGQLLKERKILSKGHFYEYAGRDFCGRYVGETAPKTAAMCRDAYGSVLFIDEAYSLYRGNADSNDYGREAIDTLIAQMENHRHDLMVIMAGYPGDMDTLMNANSGLASRMPYVIHFPNYSREDLTRIFMSMVKSHFQYEEALEEAVSSYFANLPDSLLESKEFANARFARNLFERTMAKASVRRLVDPDTPFMLCACDFDKASADREFQQLQKKKVTIGF